MSNRTSERNRRRKKIARRKERQTTTKSKNWSTISPGTMEITQPNHRVTYACTNRFPLALALLAIFVVVFTRCNGRKREKLLFFCLFDHNHFHNLASGMTSSFRCWELCVRVSERVREGVWARRDMDYETRGTLTYWRECERNERTMRMIFGYRSCMQQKRTCEDDLRLMWLRKESKIRLK